MAGGFRGEAVLCRWEKNVDIALSDITTEALLAELERRKKAKPAAPVPLASPDFQPLIRMLAENVAMLEAGGRDREDFDHYVYEAACEAIYGKDYWTWMRAR